MSTGIAFRLPRCVLSRRQRRFFRSQSQSDQQAQGDRLAKYTIDISRHVPSPRHVPPLTFLPYCGKKGCMVKEMQT